jgi:hypothetical protein
MTNLNLESLTKAEKLALLLQVAQSVLQDNPTSLIAAQVVYHAGYLAGNTGKNKGGAK